MRFLLLLFYIITHIVYVSAAVEPKYDLLSNEYLGQKMDTLLFQIKEQQDHQIRNNIPSSALFLKNPSNVDQLTAGQKIVSIKASADYTFNNVLNLRVFYDRVVNTPYISLSFPATNTHFGVSVRNALMQ